jgi:peptidyl-prolyl cis-trans isomerase D
MIPGTVDPKDAALAQVAAELGQLTGREQGEALRRAIRAEVKVKRYDAGLKTVAGQLGGAN